MLHQFNTLGILHSKLGGGCGDGVQGSGCVVKTAVGASWGACSVVGVHVLSWGYMFSCPQSVVMSSNDITIVLLHSKLSSELIFEKLNQ